MGSFKCICDDGFSIKERMEEGCTDDNECELDLYHCDSFAQCKNTNGSYDCICREGFSGDGFSCQVCIPLSFLFVFVHDENLLCRTSMNVSRTTEVVIKMLNA